MIYSRYFASSETREQIVGARENLNGREKIARREDQFQTVAAVLTSDWC